MLIKCDNQTVSFLILSYCDHNLVCQIFFIHIPHFRNNEDTSSTNLYGLAGDSEARFLGSFLNHVVNLFECFHPCSMNMMNIQSIAKQTLRFLYAYFRDFNIIFCLANAKLFGATNSDFKYIRISQNSMFFNQLVFYLILSHLIFNHIRKGIAFIQTEIEPFRHRHAFSWAWKKKLILHCILISSVWGTQSILPYMQTLGIS